MTLRAWFRRPLARLTALGGCAVLCALVSLALGQSPTAAAPNVLVRSVSVLPGKERIGVQIITSRPVTPRISSIEQPARIVVDVPDAVFSPGQQLIPAPSAEVRSVRVSQLSRNPAAVRIVVELARPLQYSMIGSGGKLVLWLVRSTQAAAADLDRSGQVGNTADSASPTQAMEQAMAPVGRVVNAPTTVSAAPDTTIVNLPRGGQVQVCPNTALSLTSSQGGRDLMLGMSTGALETHYTLATGSADLILTPDFRILLPGPGTFDFAVSTDHQGNTCVRSLAGSTAAVVVSELMGDETAQVGPNEQSLFRAGRVKNASSTPAAGCGCPRPVVPIMRASTPPPDGLTEQAEAAPAAPPTASAATPVPSESAETRDAPPAPLTRNVNPNELHVQVEAPFVFRANEAQAPPPPVVAHLRLASKVPAALRATNVEPPALVQFYRVPPRKAAKERHGFFGKLRGVFSGMFR